ncbi:hypothetical protein GCM10011348_17380 [Marinobacterium nitratireducens]|uniref:Uncharacterized protein n=1 Tax=Marinobacterium nitratireducens TaxID=518897 RepID=A0A917ZC52_9GAMM|nr:hypothetical protein GCM10011348_17380 [Marinobacterium nitratireducens]
MDIDWFTAARDCSSFGAIRSTLPGSFDTHLTLNVVPMVGPLTLTTWGLESQPLSSASATNKVASSEAAGHPDVSFGEEACII